MTTVKSIMQPISSTRSQLFQILPPSIYDDNNQCDNHYIPYPDVNSYRELIEHQQFNEIQQQFLSDILALKNLALNYVGYTYDKKIDAFRNTIVESSWNESPALLDIYKTTRYEIHQLISVLSKKHTSTTRDYLANLLHDCLYGMDHCLDGVASRFKLSFINLKTVQGGLQGFVYNIKAELAHIFISSFIFKLQKTDPKYINESMEIHYFNAFHNLLCDKFQFEKITDSYEPKDISSDLTQRFLDLATLHVSDFSVVQKLAQYWINKLSTILKELKLEHWSTDPISPEEMTFERLEIIDKNVFQPMNGLHETVTKKGAIDFYNIAKEVNNDCYSINQYQHKIHAWVAIQFCDEPRVLTKIYTDGQTHYYIGSMNQLFFWVFTNDSVLCQQATCRYDINNYTSLNLTHLVTVDFSTWKENVYYPLLIQAIKQTKVANDFVFFFYNPFVIEQLNALSSEILKLFFNEMSEKYITSHNDTFKQVLTSCINHYLQTKESKLSLKEKITFLIDTPLFSYTLFNLHDDKSSFNAVIEVLTLKQIILSCLPETMLKIYQQGQYNVILLFKELIAVNKVELAVYLLKNGCAQTLMKKQSYIQNALLILFAKHNYLEAVQCILLWPNININHQDKHGYTSLMHAIINGSSACAQTLISQKDIHLKKKNNMGWTALHCAAHFGQVTCLQAILTKDCNQINEKDYDGWTPLHHAIYRGDVDCLKALLSKENIRVNKKDNGGWTPLHCAVYYYDVDCLQTLLTNTNTQVNKKDYGGWTALHVAANYGNLRCLKILLTKEEVDVNAKDNKDWTALHYAATFGYIHCLYELLAKENIQVNVKVNQGWTPLHLAAYNYRHDCLKALLDKKDIQVNEAGGNGWTALHICARFGYLNCLQSLLATDNIQVNMRRSDDWNALHYAAYCNNPDCLSALLLNENIKINEKDKRGRTPLYLAAFKKRETCLQLLLERNDLLIADKKVDCMSEINKAVRDNNHTEIKRLLLSLNEQFFSSKVKAKKLDALSLAASNMPTWQYVCAWVTLAYSRSVIRQKKDCIVQ